MVLLATCVSGVSSDLGTDDTELEAPMGTFEWREHLQELQKLSIMKGMRLVLIGGDLAVCYMK